MVAAEPILLSAPHVGPAEEEAVARAVRSGWLAPAGEELDLFEKEISSALGVRYAVGLSSGTAALHLALKAVGVGPGDVVITSTMTFVATANAASYLGAKLFFVDVEDDGTASASSIEAAVKSANKSGFRVGAIVPVDIYGRAANYTEIIPMAASHSIPVVADAAESLGSMHGGAPAGSFGDVAALSFNGNKIMTTSGGGMLLTSEQEIAEYVRYLANQAKDAVSHYEHREVGYNYRLSNILAALGRAQFARLPEMVSRRREIREAYGAFFEGFEGVGLMPGVPSEDNCWLTSILVDPSAGWTPSQMQGHLQQVGIESRALWKPMHLQPVYQSALYGGGNAAENLFKWGLALPSGSVLTDTDLNRVLGAMAEFLRKH